VSIDSALGPHADDAAAAAETLQLEQEKWISEEAKAVVAAAAAAATAAETLRLEQEKNVSGEARAVVPAALALVKWWVEHDDGWALCSEELNVFLEDMFMREATSETRFAQGPSHELQFSFDYYDGKYIQKNVKSGTECELKRQAAGDPDPVDDLDIADEEDAADDLPDARASKQNPSLAQVVDEHWKSQLKTVTSAKEPATPAWTPPATGEQDDEGTEVVHPTQRRRAEELFDMMKQRLGGNLNRFKRFELRIQVPNLNTLHDQTVDRLKQYIRHHRKTVAGFLGRHVDVSVDEAGEKTEDYLTGGLVQKNNKSHEQQAKRKKLMKDIKNNPDTLFLVVHDEAHYEATKGGAADMLINDEILRNAPNVVTLFVSATPYNLVTEDSQVPEANVVFWDTNGDNANPQAPRYFGLPHYEANLCDADFPQEQIPQGSLCACDAKFNATVDAEQHKLRAAGTFSGEGQKKNVAQAALLNTVISEYVGALNHVKEDGGGRSMFPTDGSVDVSNSLTNRMVRDLVNTPVESEDGSGIMIMLRQPATTGRQIFNAVKDARNKLGLQGRFAVLMDLESKAQGGLRRCMETHNPEIYKAMLAAADDRDLPLDQYSDLESVPCILILCEKGKMGKLLVRTVNFAVLESTLTHACGL